MSVKVTPCDKTHCKCYELQTVLENARDHTKWQFGVEFFSTEFIEEQLDMQLDLCKKAKNPFYC